MASNSAKSTFDCVFFDSLWPIKKSLYYTLDQFNVTI